MKTELTGGVPETLRFERITVLWDRGSTEEILGRRVIMEGADQDTTRLISLLGVVARQEIDESVGVIRFDGSNYKSLFLSTPFGLLPDSIELNWHDFERASEHDLGGVRAFILDDGRIFVRESRYEDVSYREQFLFPAIARAWTEFDR